MSLIKTLMFVGFFNALTFAALPTLAVIELKGDSNVSLDQLDYLTGKLAAEFLNSKKFNVLDRSRIDLILKEQGFQQTGACNDQECQVKIGQLLGVEYLVAGSLVRFGPSYMLRLDYLDVATGRILHSLDHQEKGELHDIVLPLTTTVVKNLVAEITGQSKPIQINPTNTIEKPTTPSWKWPVVAGLGVGGLSLFILGILADKDITKFRQSYDKVTETTPQAKIDEYYDNAKTAESQRNLYYGLGAFLLASGITISISF